MTKTKKTKRPIVKIYHKNGTFYLWVFQDGTLQYFKKAETLPLELPECEIEILPKLESSYRNATNLANSVAQRIVNQYKKTKNMQHAIGYIEFVRIRLEWEPRQQRYLIGKVFDIVNEKLNDRRESHA